MDLRRGKTTAHSYIFITSCRTSACMVPMAALGKEAGARREGLPGPRRGYGSGQHWPSPQLTGNRPQLHVLCLYLTLRRMCHHNLQLRISEERELGTRT